MTRAELDRFFSLSESILLKINHWFRDDNPVREAVRELNSPIQSKADLELLPIDYLARDFILNELKEFRDDVKKWRAVEQEIGAVRFWDEANSDDPKMLGATGAATVASMLLFTCYDLDLGFENLDDAIRSGGFAYPERICPDRVESLLLEFKGQDWFNRAFCNANIVLNIFSDFAKFRLSNWDFPKFQQELKTEWLRACKYAAILNSAGPSPVDSGSTAYDGGRKQDTVVCVPSDRNSRRDEYDSVLPASDTRPLADRISRLIETLRENSGREFWNVLEREQTDLEKNVSELFPSLSKRCCRPVWVDFMRVEGCQLKHCRLEGPHVGTIEISCHDDPDGDHESRVKNVLCRWREWLLRTRNGSETVPNVSVSTLDADNETSESIAAIEKKTPALDPESIDWIHARKKNLKILGLPLKTLREYRTPSKGGRSNSSETFGIDAFGRIWRRQGTPSSSVYYLRSSLSKNDKEKH